MKEQEEEGGGITKPYNQFQKNGFTFILPGSPNTTANLSQRVGGFCIVISRFWGTPPLEPLSQRLRVGVSGQVYPLCDTHDRLPQGSPKGAPRCINASALNMFPWRCLCAKGSESKVFTSMLVS